MGIGARIKEAAVHVGGQRSLSKMIDVSERTLSDYVAEKSSPQVAVVQKIARATGADLYWLIEGRSLEGVKQANEVSLPRYAVQASAGGGALVLSEEVNGTFTVGRDWLARYVPPGAKTGIIEARGDSMEPTIFDGDILLLNFSIDRSAVDGGGVFVITVDGSLLVKRLQVTLDGHVLVLSDNDNYETEKVTREYADERMIVHAQVVWSGGPIRRR